MAERQPTKFKAPARAASPLVASKPLLIADARQAMDHVEKAEREKAGDPAREAAGDAPGGAARGAAGSRESATS